MLAMTTSYANWAAAVFRHQLAPTLLDGLNAPQEGERQQKPVYFCCGPTAHQRANAAVLVRHHYLI